MAKAQQGTPSLALPALEDIQAERARRSLRYYVEHMWPVVEPTTPFIGGWHLDAICDHLQAVRLGIKDEHATGAIRRLIINVPPRMTKPVDEIEWVVEQSRGRVRLKDIVVGDMVLTHRGRFRRVTSVHRQGEIPVVMVTTAKGRQVKAAPDHPFLTIEGWKQAGMLVPGKDVVAAVRVPSSCHGTEGISPEASRLLGYLIGDGCTKYAQVMFTNADAEVLADARACAKALGFFTRDKVLAGCKAISVVIKATADRWTGGTYHQKQQSPLRQWIELHGLRGACSYTKRIPAAVLSSPPHIIAEFLGAYWSCDGSVLTRKGVKKGSLRIIAVTVSAGLASDIQHALLRMGISARVMKKQTKLKSKRQGDLYTSYLVEVEAKDAWKFGRVVKMRHVAKQVAAEASIPPAEFDHPLAEDAVVSVEPAGTAKCRCLSVDEDCSFTANDIAVHNSLTVSVGFPTWLWIDVPSFRSIHTSYSQDLSVRDSVKSRAVIQSPWYQRNWGQRFALSGDVNLKGRYENDKTGFRLATSVTGMATGEGGDGIFIDDPHNVKDTLGTSQASLQEVMDWFDFVLPTRFNNQKTGFLVLIMQRVHHKDLTGHILAKELGYTHLCYPDDTEVLTRGGWKLFKNLSPDEDVMGVSPDTLVGKWERPTSHVRYKYHGKLRHWKSDVLDLAVTPDHRMVYKDYNDWKVNKHTKWRVAPASQLPRHFYVPQTVVWKGSSDSPSFAGKMWDAGAFADFMGWYLAEGCAGAKACSTRIVQSSKHKRYVAEIKETLSRIPFDSQSFEKREDGMLCWTVWSKPLAEALAALGKSKVKYVPDVVKGMTPKLLQRFIIAFAKGDGHFSVRNPRKIEIYSCSKRMIDDLHECCVKAGWAASVVGRFQEGKGKFPNGYAQKSVMRWKLYIRASKAVGQDRKWYAKVRAANCFEQDYNGDVFCVSVPSTALVVRRNGRVAVSGNCLPMEYEANHPHLWAADPRSIEGELLCPDRVGPAELATLKKTLRSYGSAGQLQQRPAPREGGMIKRHFFQVVGRAPVDVERTVRWWDMAATEKVAGNDPDWTAGARVSMTADGMAYVEHVVAERESSFAVEKLIKSTAAVDGTGVDVWMEQEPGSSGKTVINSYSRKLSGLGGYKFRGERSGKNKETYVELLAAAMESGSVLWVRGPWLERVIEQACAFPNADHDDEIEAVAKAYCKLATRVHARARDAGQAAEQAVEAVRVHAQLWRALKTVADSGGHATLADFIDWHEPVGDRLWDEAETLGLAATNADGHVVLTPAGQETVDRGPAGDDELLAQRVRAAAQQAEYLQQAADDETDWEAVAEANARRIYGDAVVTNWSEAAARGAEG